MQLPLQPTTFALQGRPEDSGDLGAIQASGGH